MTDISERLRALPTFPDELPVLDPATAPDDPIELLVMWLDEAIASGERQPNAMTFTTIDDDGRPTHRTLIVKDVDERGLHVASSRESRKGRHLRARPWAGTLFFWRPLGRQLEITGAVSELSAEESARDWRERPGYTGVDNPSWRVWALRPERMEFFQATHDRRHIRLEYRRSGSGWTRTRLGAGEQAPATAD